MVTVGAQEDHQVYREELPALQEDVLDLASSPLEVAD